MGISILILHRTRMQLLANALTKARRLGNMIFGVRCLQLLREMKARMNGTSRAANEANQRKCKPSMR
ncbi:hypothetical protein D3C85_1844810 [compost metagenome]